MSEVISIALGITSICSVIGSMLYVKRSFSTDKLIERLEDITDEIATNKDLQGKIYTIGGLLGNGIRAGVGIGGKTGKFKLEDLAMGLAAKYLGLGGEGGIPPQQQEQNLLG